MEVDPLSNNPVQSKYSLLENLVFFSLHFPMACTLRLADGFVGEQLSLWLGLWRFLGFGTARTLASSLFLRGHCCVGVGVGSVIAAFRRGCTRTSNDTLGVSTAGPAYLFVAIKFHHGR